MYLICVRGDSENEGEPPSWFYCHMMPSAVQYSSTLLKMHSPQDSFATPL